MRQNRLMIALGLVLLLFGGVLPVHSSEPTWENAQVEAERGGYRLITTDELWERYQEGGEDLHPPGLGVPHGPHRGRRALLHGAHVAGPRAART